MVLEPRVRSKLDYSYMPRERYYTGANRYIPHKQMDYRTCYGTPTKNFECYDRRGRFSQRCLSYGYILARDYVSSRETRYNSGTNQYADTLCNYKGPTEMSPSSAIGRKQRRDRRRMTEFICRKTAESMPFATLQNKQILKLSFNSAKGKQCTDTNSSVFPVEAVDTLTYEISHLQTEICQLNKTVTQMSHDANGFQKQITDLKTKLKFDAIMKERAMELLADEKSRADSYAEQVKLLNNELLLNKAKLAEQTTQLPTTRQTTPQLITTSGNPTTLESAFAPLQLTLKNTFERHNQVVNHALHEIKHKVSALASQVHVPNGRDGPGLYVDNGHNGFNGGYNGHLQPRAQRRRYYRH